ncbi:hypothetical protein VTJ04DRAFT_3660 [Mycothermus thermophilus]|uniref:uncharacterized protein n=1 Tax=Humicola insolens TaxID=85995 RepID=UPI003742B778
MRKRVGGGSSWRRVDVEDGKLTSGGIGICTWPSPPHLRRKRQTWESKWDILLPEVPQHSSPPDAAITSSLSQPSICKSFLVQHRQISVILMRIKPH